MARIALLAALPALLLALPAQSAVPKTRVKNTRGWIESIAMDGPRLAYDVSARFRPGPACNKLFVWNVQTRAGTLVSGKGTCAADSTSTGAGVREIAIAGTQVAWIVNLGGNTESGDYLYTASLPKPKEKLLASATRTGDVSGTLAGGWIGGLVGANRVIAVNRWTTDARGGISNPSLERVGKGLAEVASGPDVLVAHALDLGRVAVLRADGTVALYDADAGDQLLVVRPSSVREIALRKDYLLVLTRSRTLEIYNAHSGAPVKTWPVAAGAARLDAHSGVAAYSAGRRVHVLRFSDGKDAVLATAPRAIVALAMEAPGIAYAYNTVKGTRDVGNLAFVPKAKVTALLR